MSITAKSVYRDTGDFLRYQFITILLIVLSCTVITAVIGHVLSPSEEQFSSVMDADNLAETNNPFELVQSMTLEQQKMLLHTSAAATVAGLTGYALLIGALVVLMQRVTARQPVSALSAMGASVPTAPKLFLLLLLTIFIVQLGMLFLYVPGIFLAIFLALAPILLVHEKMGVFASMRSSMRFSRANMRFVAPPVVAWLLTKFLMLRYGHHLIAFSPEGGAIIANALSNLFSAVLLIYLFRLYMLMRK
ncbi:MULTISPECIES: YciC family protein [Kosakonia]|jgi:hypothetical protein|uniref:YciC family protein n=1 Tax=Kosakonia TaxID=1330547 RepID=UPI001907A399|nr:MULTISPECIES: YciC family protein [Kosakonia]MBK0078541.1 UPF0259 family protein [Kosakonia sp. S57]MBK0085590.1 UPF0259 family protein [Kosakonia sp. S58]MBS5772332.1 UPF0259 family protein [Enterobacter cloacae]